MAAASALNLSLPSVGSFSGSVFGWMCSDCRSLMNEPRSDGTPDPIAPAEFTTSTGAMRFSVDGGRGGCTCAWGRIASIEAVAVAAAAAEAAAESSENCCHVAASDGGGIGAENDRLRLIE